MKKKEKESLRTLKPEEASHMIMEIAQKLITLRADRVRSQVKNTHEMTAFKRKKAMLLTFKREKELQTV